MSTLAPFFGRRLSPRAKQGQDKINVSRWGKHRSTTHPTRFSTSSRGEMKRSLAECSGVASLSPTWRADNHLIKQAYTMAPCLLLLCTHHHRLGQGNMRVFVLSPGGRSRNRPSERKQSYHTVYCQSFAIHRHSVHSLPTHRSASIHYPKTSRMSKHRSAALLNRWQLLAAPARARGVVIRAQWWSAMDVPAGSAWCVQDTVS